MITIYRNVALVVKLVHGLVLEVNSKR